METELGEGRGKLMVELGEDPENLRARAQTPEQRAAEYDAWAKAGYPPVETWRRRGGRKYDPA